MAIKEFYPSAMASRQEDTIILNDERERAVFLRVLKRFQSEAKLQFDFNHPNILKVRNYIAAEDTGYMISDYIDGGSLRNFLEKYGGHFPTERMFHDIMAQIAGAVGYVHRRGTLHRDISPDNIMVDGFGKATLVDFGAAKLDLRASQAYSSIVVLKEDYAPPEQRDPAPDRPESFYTDIFALGGTMYCTLAGVPPKRATARLAASADPYVPIAQSSRS